MTTDYLNDLNEEQRAAVECTEGPSLIVAGAGSGKTRVLTTRVAYIIEKGADPSTVLALTFTKKAATEMKERIALLVGGRNARRIVMGTFHSIFVRFLREYADLTGYPGSFTIYDQSDSQSAVKACIKELNLSDAIYKPREVLSRISTAKNNLITAERYATSADIISKDRASRKGEIFRVYLLYQQKLRQSAVMDFDDILLNMNILFRDHPEALEQIASRFRYIMVDEYQDTNYAQYLIIKKLSQEHRNICVVGDDSQSIYAFRGARLENILGFKKDYPECRVFRLEKNYRSTLNIVEAANSLIEKNSERIPKTCVSMGDEGEKIHLTRAFTESEEAALTVTSIIRRMRDDGAQYQDFAVLYRTNAQSRALEEALRRRNLPYVIYSGNSFFERAEVKDMMAYFKLAVNPSDDESFRRIVNKPARGIGATSLAALDDAAKSLSMPLFKAAHENNLERFGLKAPAVKKILEFCSMIEKAAEKALTEDAYPVAEGLSRDSGLYALYKLDNSIEGQARAANIEELVNSVAEYGIQRGQEYVSELLDDGTISDPSEVPDDSYPKVLLGDFLENISLLANIDIEDGDTSNKIALMTVHSAKGLEFPYVYVAGMEENLFPSGSMLASESDIEEERRLCYVAMTRAKKALTLSYSTSRIRNGSYVENPPSRFLREINPRYLDHPLPGEGGSFTARAESSSVSGSGGWWSRSSSGPSRSSSGPSRGPSVQRPSPAPPAARPLPPKIPDSEFVPDPSATFREGDRIEHNRFGPGTIKSISGEEPDRKSRIVFDRFGEKIMLLKFAKMRKI